MKEEILHGDCLELMKFIPDKSIDLTVTSPPYDNLRTYNGSLDWGEHVWKPVIQELYRVTKQGGVVVWVVGDATIKGSETGTSFRQALYFKETGFNLHDTMLYKTNKIPLNHNRYEQEFEYMFVFSKGKPKTFNPIKVPCIYAGTSTSGTFRHTGKELSKAHTIKPISETKIKGNVWEIVSGNMKGTLDKIAFQHPATFPDKLAEDHILSWSNEGDIVLDPMAGSGTTLKMAKKNNRNYIGIEISKEYVDIIKQRLTPLSQ